MNLGLPVSVPETPEDLTKAPTQNSHYSEQISIHVDLYNTFNVFSMLTYTYITNTVTVPVCLLLLAYCLFQYKIYP